MATAVPFNYRVLSAAAPTDLDQSANDPLSLANSSELRLHGEYAGPRPDHADFPAFVGARWRETLASWGGTGHMIISKAPDGDAALAKKEYQLVCACVQDDKVFGTVNYWGQPADKPRILVVPLPTGSDVVGLATEGVPEDLLDASGLYPVYPDDQSFVVRHYPHGEPELQ
jgi:hypothetical protein